MGLPVLTIDARLVSSWRSILERNGFSVRLDQDEIDKEQLLKEKYPVAKDIPDGGIASKWETIPWLITKEKAEIRVLETPPQDQHGGVAYIVFMPNSTREGRQLFLHVHKVLLASGALQGTHSDRKDEGTDQ